MRTLLVAILWLGSLAGAYVLGGHREGLLAGGAPPELGPRDPAGVADAPRSLTEPVQLEGRPGAAADAAGAAGAPARPRLRLEDVPAFTLEGAETPEDVNARLLAYVEALLAAGPEGHLALLRFLDEQIVAKGGVLRRLGSSDEELIPYLYPWLRFAVAHEGQVVDLVETVMKTMAEDPAAFDGLDDNTLEVVTEGLAPFVPGAVGAERLARLRDYAERAFAESEGSTVAAVRSNRGELGRLLRFWAPPLDVDQVLAKLRAGPVEPGELGRLLARVPVERLDEVDLVGLLGAGLASGDGQLYGSLRQLQLPADAAARLDGTVLDGMARGQVSGWHAASWLQGTGRGGWPAARRFVEAALALGPPATAEAGSTLTRLAPPPDAAWLQWAMGAYELPEPIERWMASMVEGR